VAYATAVECRALLMQRLRPRDVGATGPKTKVGDSYMTKCENF